MLYTEERARLRVRIRPAAVADRFYPADPQSLKALLEDQLAHAIPGAPDPKAIVMPHAGIVYSGPIAASAAAPLGGRRGSLRRVVVAGPSHHVPVRGIALTACSSFETPLGRVPVDTETVGALSTLSGVRVDESAHAREHSIEVELPFLQHLLGSFLLVPLLIGESNPAAIADILEELCADPDTLLVISTDLSHFLPYDEARVVDARTARAVEERREKAIGWQDACGRNSLRAALVLARRLGWTVRTVDLRNSGDTAGDRRSVVGYGAWHLERGATS